ncbi:uncharacterized protein LOC144623188 [Crassostrea virginica]
MASTVVCPALTTVNTTHVTYNMGIALDVSLDGHEQCVTRSVPGDGTVLSVYSGVWDTVCIMFFVITRLVSVTEAVLMDGTDSIVTKRALGTVSITLHVTRRRVCVTGVVMPGGVVIHVMNLVTTAPLDMAASTTVLVSVWITLHVTNRVDIMTGDVNQGIQMFFATKVVKTPMEAIVVIHAVHTV